MTKSALEKSTKSIRIVLDIPTPSMNNLRTLCDLTGEGQSEIITRALDSFVERNKATLDKFLELRSELLN